MLLTLQQLDSPNTLTFHYSASSSEHLTLVKQQVQPQYSVLEMDPHYQIEARDPLHHWAPKLNEVMMEYKELIREQDFVESGFFVWVKNNKPTLPRTQYLNPAELEACKQKLMGPNLVVNANGEKHTHSKDTPVMKMFVMDAQGDFYVHEKVKPTEEKPGFNHSSFLQGAPVAGVGFMHFNQAGELVAIDDYSGHYKPTREQVLNVMHALKEKGFNLSEISYNHRISQESFDKEIHNAQSWYDDAKSTSERKHQRIF